MRPVAIKSYERFKPKFQQFVTSHLHLLTFFMVCGMPDVISNISYVLEYPSSMAEIISMVPICLLKVFTESVLLSWLCVKLPRMLSKILLVLTAILAIGDLMVLYEYKFLLNFGLLQILLGTNAKESSEFLYTYRKDIVDSALMAVSMGWILFCVMKSGIRIINRDNRILPVIVLLGMEAFGYMAVNYGNLVSFSIASARCATVIPMGIHEQQAYKELPKRICEEQKPLLTQDKSVPHVVFIVGESTSRNHMGIYGYPLDNTPNLSRRGQKGELEVFSDVISPQSVTILSLQRLFTFYTNESKGDWYTYGNLFGILRNAGYHTRWLSNQETGGVWGDVARFYADSCDEEAFVTERNSLSKDRFASVDGDLLPLLDEALREKNEDDFTVLHLMGCHASYSARYPEDFEKFQAADETGADEKQKAARAAYDNAILYNDYVVDQIIKRYEQEDAIIIYVSDHGEEVYDLRDYMGHYTNGSFYQVEIPMLVWTSDKFRRNHPDKFQQLREAKDRPYMTDDMIHTLLDLTGIATEDYDSTRSILNPAFNGLRDRIYNEKVYRKNWVSNSL